MKRRTRIRYTESQKAVMWDRWQQGESLHQIARVVVTVEARRVASSALATRSRMPDLLRRKRGKNRLARPQAHGAPRRR